MPTQLQALLLWEQTKDNISDTFQKECEIQELQNQNHQIIEVERDLCKSSCPTLFKQGHLEQVLQDQAQKAFKYIQGCRVCNLCQCSITLTVQMKPSVSIDSCSVTDHHWK